MHPRGLMGIATCEKRPDNSLAILHIPRRLSPLLALNGETKDGIEVRKPMSMSMVSRLLRHASTDTTEKVYAKFLPQTLSDEVNRLGFAFLPNF